VRILSVLKDFCGTDRPNSSLRNIPALMWGSSTGTPFPVQALHFQYRHSISSTGTTFPEQALHFQYRHSIYSTGTPCPVQALHFQYRHSISMSRKIEIPLPDGELVHLNFIATFGILQRTTGDSSDHLYPCLFQHITVCNLMMTLSDLLCHRIVQQMMLWGCRVESAFCYIWLT
jgi:hypothetical protein